MTREEVTALLDITRTKAPRYHGLLVCAVWTGLRQGELLALQWEDLNYQGRFIEVSRNLSRGQITTPKNGQSRRVDLSIEFTQLLRDLQTERQLEAAANGWAEVPPWVFCNSVWRDFRS